MCTTKVIANLIEPKCLQSTMKVKEICDKSYPVSGVHEKNIDIKPTNGRNEMDIGRKAKSAATTFN